VQYLDQSNRAVEEGHQKIFKFLDSLIAVRGAVTDIDEFYRATKLLIGTNDATPFLEWAKREEWNMAAEFMAIGPPSSHPILTLKPAQKALVHHEQGGVICAGSIDDRHRAILEGSIADAFQQMQDLDSHRPAFKLAIGLAVATKLSVSYNLTEQFIGGCVFGGFSDSQGAHWQPDITYILYNEIELDRFAADVGRGQIVRGDPGPKLDDYFDIVQTRVRDDVLTCVSTLVEFNLLYKFGIARDELDAWGKQWLRQFSTLGAGDCDFVVFVPKGRGVLAVCRCNGAYVGGKGSEIRIHEDLIATLHRRDNSNVVQLFSRDY
jgi:hypothetical protein